MTAMIKHVSCRLSGFATAALAAIALAGGPALAAPSYADWFRYGDEVSRSWQFVEVEGDNMKVIVRPRHQSASSKHYKVLVLYPRPSSAYDVCITRALSVFEEKEIYANLTVINFKKEQARGEAALELARQGNFDLIFSMGSESTAWLYKNYRGGAIPVVSACSKDPVLLGQTEDYERGSGTNFAFTSLNMPVEVQMAYVLELKPNLRNIAVLVDSKNVSAVQTQAEPLAHFARRRGIQVLEVAVQDPNNARAELEEMVPAAVAAMRKNDPNLENSVFWITGSTSVFREIATINTHSDRVPVLSVAPEVVKEGDDSAVLSIGVSFESNGHLAAIYAADILLGRAEVGELKVGIVSPPDIAINFRKARQIGLELPFSFLESAGYVYDYEGRIVRNNGKSVTGTK